MKKKIRIVFFVIILIILLLGIMYLIDRKRMKDNKPVIFSTWGYSYAPPATLASGQDDTGYFFYSTVVESKPNYIIVSPYEGSKELKSADKISIGLDEGEYEKYPKGTTLKITYDGKIMETYPAKIHASKIEIEE